MRPLNVLGIRGVKNSQTKSGIVRSIVCSELFMTILIR
jgi:hypothetical protein